MIKSKRIVGQYVETAIHEFDHPNIESTISLVSVLHRALPSFYDQVSDYIDDREHGGSIVHVEASGLPDDEELASYPKWVQTLAPRIRELVDGVIDEDPENGTKSQFESDHHSLNFKDHWEVHDLNAAEVVFRLGRIRSQLLASGIERSMSRRVNPVSLFIGTLGICALRLSDNVIVGDRNKVAVQAIENVLLQDENQHLTLMWGAAHTPGIARGILSKKYRHKNTIWLKADRVNSVH